MGVYSSNRSQLGMYNSDEIIANENYMGVTGAYQMMIEGFQNDQAIFESVLATDFMEAVAIQEGAAIEVVNEASLSGFIEKMKELIKKAWEKIKGLFQTFITKINNVVIRDNKKFVDKYKKDVLTKNLSKMKYKWAQPKGYLSNLETVVGTVGSDIDGLLVDALTKDINKLNEEADNGDLLEELLGCEPKEFAKETHEHCFEDLEEVEGLDSSRVTYCMDVLINSSKTLKRIEKAKSEADKAYSNMLKQIEKARNVALKNIPSDKDNKTSVKVGDDYNVKGTATDVMARLNTMTKVINIGNTSMSKISGALIAETKFEIKQARRVFAQAAAFNAKAVKENALLVEAAGDAAEYEVESSFNDYEM